MDIYCDWGQDLVLTTDGDILPAFDWDEARQFLVRLLLTNPQITNIQGKYIPPDYTAEPDFGLGLRRKIGTLPTQSQLDAIVVLTQQGIANCPAILKTPAPVVKISNPAPFEYNLEIYVTVQNQPPGKITIPLTS